MSFNLGDYVELKGYKKRKATKGYIRYQGKIPSMGDCYGIELDSKAPQGTDGSMDGKTYFKCKPGCALFVKKTRIKGLTKAPKPKHKSSPPPILTQTQTTEIKQDDFEKPIKNGTSSPNKKHTQKTKKKLISKSKSPRPSPKKRGKSPRPTDKDKAKPKPVPKLTHTATPRPRAATRDPRISPKKPGPTTSPKKASTITKKQTNKKSTPTPNAAVYPNDGSTKQKLAYIFATINRMDAATKSKGHRRTTTEISKNKHDLLKKATCIVQELDTAPQDDMVQNLLTPMYIIKEFKKILPNALKDRKLVVHRQVLRLLDTLMLCAFTRQSMSEQIIFVLKHLMSLLTHNNTKSVTLAKSSIKLLVTEILYEDNKKLIKIIMNELLRYAKTSKKKILRKYGWVYVVQILEMKYNINVQAKPLRVKPAPQALGEEKEGRVMKKKNKPPKSIMDAISSGLKAGLSDRDKEVQIEAMKVLSLFSLLEEPKADRLIAKMSTSTRKLFDSKYGQTPGVNAKKGKKTSAKTIKTRKPKINGVGKKANGPKSPRKGRKGKDKKRKDSKGRYFTLKEDPVLSKKEDKKSKKKAKKNTTNGKKNDKKTNTVTSKAKKADKKAKKTPKKDAKSTNDNEPPTDRTDTIENDETKQMTLETVTNEMIYDMHVDDDNDDNDDNDNDDDIPNNIAAVRERRRKIRGQRRKDRSAGTFGTGDEENMGFDMSAIGALVMGGMDDEDDAHSDDDDIHMNMNGDIRNDMVDGVDAAEEYSSSTETYEGDNDIEIYDFPRKDALSNDSGQNEHEFNIDIDRYLSNNNPEYNWKFGNEEMLFFSHKHNTHLLMSRISQIKCDTVINYDDEEMKWINKLLDYEVDYNDLSLIKDTTEFWPTDIDSNYMDIVNGKINYHSLESMNSNINSGDDVDALYDNPADAEMNMDGMDMDQHAQHGFICATQISYNLMRLLTNEHGSDWIKSFISDCIYEITVHALCVFHPLSAGNVYHGRVILEVLLNHFPRDFFKYLVEDNHIIQALLKYAVFNNIHHGNLNSFVMDLICFSPESIQQRDDIESFAEKCVMSKECSEYKDILLQNVLCEKWKFVENVMVRALNQHCDDVSTKYSVFFVDLVARCASIESTKCLFEGCQDLIIDSFVSGLLGKKGLNFWQRIRCGQSLVEYLDLASRPTIMDPSVASTPFGFMQAQNAYKENIFYASFKYCLARLIHYIDDLCMMIIAEEHSEENREIILSYGSIASPLGRLKLNALELLTVTIDFHEMNCALVLKQIPISFWAAVLDMAFVHKYNNMFLCHFRRLVHLAMIFRRRILKHLCTECNMVARMVQFYEENSQRTELHGYILQMLNDIYCHDSEIKHIQ